MLKRFSGAAAFLAALLTFVRPALAGLTLNLGTGLPTVQGSDFAGILTKIGEGFGVIAGAAAFGMLVYYGIRMIMAIDERARSDAIAGIRHVLMGVGVGVVGLAYVIVGFAVYLIANA